MWPLRIVDDELFAFLLTVILKSLSVAHIHTQDLNFVTQKSVTQLLRALSCLQVLDTVGSPPSGLAWALLLNARMHDPKCMVPDDGGWNHRVLIPQSNDVYLRNIGYSSGGNMLSRTTTINSYYDLDDSHFLDVINATLCERSVRVCV